MFESCPDFKNLNNKTMKVRVGQVVTVENTYKKRFANPTYQAVYLRTGNQYNCYLFTDEELEKAQVRGAINCEDHPDRSFISKLID